MVQAMTKHQATPDRTRKPAVHQGIRATRIVVATLGVLVGLAGIEHGVGEILQGSVRPQGLAIQSWAHSQAFQILGGEPAMTVIPNLLVTGVLAVIVALAVAARVNLSEADSLGNHCVVVVSSFGWLIQTAPGSAGGWGGLPTKRSGWAA